MENLIERTQRYFELFSTKNVKGLENEIYSEDIHLRDRNGECKGKYSVLEMNDSLFINEFKIVIDDIKLSDTSTIVLFTLHISDTEYKVVDIIDWDENGKIKRILAYNG